MEFLKDLFGAEALTYDQLAAKVAEKKMKLADISTGAYVGKEKFESLPTRGVWIEMIFLFADASSQISSLPTRGVWIER